MREMLDEEMTEIREGVEQVRWDFGVSGMIWEWILSNNMYKIWWLTYKIRAMEKR